VSTAQTLGCDVNEAGDHEEERNAEADSDDKDEHQREAVGDWSAETDGKRPARQQNTHIQVTVV